MKLAIRRAVVAIAMPALLALAMSNGEARPQAVSQADVQARIVPDCGARDREGCQPVHQDRLTIRRLGLPPKPIPVAAIRANAS